MAKTVTTVRAGHVDIQNSGYNNISPAVFSVFILIILGILILNKVNH